MELLRTSRLTLRAWVEVDDGATDRWFELTLRQYRKILAEPA